MWDGAKVPWHRSAPLSSQANPAGVFQASEDPDVKIPAPSDPSSRARLARVGIYNSESGSPASLALSL